MKVFRNHLPVFQCFLVAMLLGIYISAIFFNNLHEYILHGHQHHEICTEETEKDPCHKRVFHHDLSQGCKHNTHILSLENPCTLCDAILAKYYSPDKIQLLHDTNIPIKNEAIFEAQIVPGFSYSSIKERAPPGFSAHLA